MSNTEKNTNGDKTPTLKGLEHSRWRPLGQDDSTKVRDMDVSPYPDQDGEQS